MPVGYWCTCCLLQTLHFELLGRFPRTHRCVVCIVSASATMASAGTEGSVVHLQWFAAKPADLLLISLSFTKNIMSRTPSRSRLVKEMVDAASQGRTETMRKLE